MNARIKKLRTPLDTGDSDDKIRLLSLEEKTRKALFSSQARIFFLCFSFLLGFFFIGMRAVELSIVGIEQHKTEYAVQKIKTRSDITDRKGELLAASLKTHSLFANPRKVWDAEETTQAVLSVLPDLDGDKIRQRLQSDRSFVWIARNLTPKQKQDIFSLGMPGLMFKVEPKRIYPRGRLAVHVLGWTDIDLKGISGIEGYFNTILEGTDLAQSSLALSIDMGVQFALDQAMRSGMETYQAKGAAGLIMNVKNGEILGMISLPDFDPNTLSSSKDSERMNRASLSLYEMGSTFKIFTLAAALENKAVELSDIFDITRPLKISGHFIHDSNASAYPMTAEEILIHSSNKGAALLAFETGIEKQKVFLQKLGLLEKAPIELYETASPLLPKQWKTLEAATISYGHGLSVSLIALGAALAACVNGGEYITPTLLKQEEQERKGRRVLSVESSKTLVRVMRKVVEEGTGRHANIPGYQIAGKTGSAEKPGLNGYEKKKLISSFVGVFPASDPHYLVVVLYDEPQPGPETRGQITGGWNAAFTVGTIIKHIAPILGVKKESK